MGTCGYTYSRHNVVLCGGGLIAATGGTKANSYNVDDERS